MKKILSLLLAVMALLGCLALSGCGEQQPETPAYLDLISNLDTPIKAKLKKVGMVPYDGDFGVAQGACTDGKYIYVILENQKVDGEGGYQKNDHYGKIFKVDPATMKIVAKSEPLLIDHGNDVTYNPKTKQLIVVHNAPNRKKLSFVDPETLTVTDTLTHSELEMYAIAYNEKTDQYVVGLSHGYDFAILDNQFNLVQKFSGKVTGYTKQNFDCDEKYIYMLQYNSNTIQVYDWDGNFVREIALNYIEEPESLLHIGSQFYYTTYMGGKNGGRILTIEFQEDK